MPSCGAYVGRGRVITTVVCIVIQINVARYALCAVMGIGALPRRCGPFSLTESGPLKSRKNQSNRVRVLFSPSAHERQCEALGFMNFEDLPGGRAEGLRQGPLAG